MRNVISFRGSVLFLICSLISKSSAVELGRCQQLLVVTPDNWESHRGVLQRFQRIDEDASWKAVGHPLPVVIGKAGLGWGVGLHSTEPDLSPIKVEGDLKSPAGIFTLGVAFGFFSQEEMSYLKVPYLTLTDLMEAVDDPLSAYYNQLVSRDQVVSVDWTSSEKMAQISLYKLGMVINHNFPQPQKGAGSAIFFHIWAGESSSGTAGCTSMSFDNLNEVLSWLDTEKDPLLVQLPKNYYQSLEKDWGLPKLDRRSNNYCSKSAVDFAMDD